MVVLRIGRYKDFSDRRAYREAQRAVRLSRVDAQAPTPHDLGGKGGFGLREGKKGTQGPPVATRTYHLI